MSRRYPSGRIEIEASDVIEQIDDKDILDEVRRRDLHLETVNDLDALKDAYRELICGRSAEALAILDRIINPKWPSAEHCAKEYSKARPA